MNTVRTAAVAVAAGVAVAGLGVWPGDLPVFWAVTLGVPAAAVAAVGARFSGALEPRWAPLPDPADSATEPQAANLATRLAEAADDPVRFHTRLRPRLRRLALATLRAEHGVSDLDDPRAVDLLGADLHALLTDPAAVLPGPERLERMLARLEEL
ncbi:hypothetical protein L6E12_32465 [Actinokineospora sp. PR83]|uniref:hypothetical protein n=1 Tax=Actinokineospora sp. PR83 TaxID=2884908 RepID=UPI001F22A012|nr:hypothetical protein [Actinokineospora sp. PR83]MCG8920491.1 hypothetical protein [Actinokineospora sp. PR83]